jgi:Flp pilus assembly protein TadG
MMRRTINGVYMGTAKISLMRRDLSRDDKGQILILFALAFPLLVLFTAMAVDMGLIYVTRAKLSKAVDAACLTGVKNLSQGQTTANALATDMFNANFGPNPPVPNFTWTTGSSTTPVSLQVQATATTNTIFMKYLPQFATWYVGDTATATRSNLVMSIILDRSGSMNGNGGGTALKSAVPNFVDDFVDGTDHIGMVSFASNATVDVALTSSFATPIKNAVKTLNFNGGTFGTGAGTNSHSTTDGPPLSMADDQNGSVSYVQETKVVVYFTDGLMNTIQDTFNCTNNPPGLTLYNYGGYDPPGTGVAALVPTNGTQWPDIPTNGPPPYGTGGGTCNGVSSFFSQQNNTTESFTRSHVTAEAQWRAIYTANAMRAETPVATYIYVIGLGHAVSGDVPTEAFLATLANDPNGPSTYTGAVYNSSLPAGLFLVVPDCPSSACTNELNTAFQTIAAKILLRLTQ